MPDQVLCLLADLPDPGAKGPFRVGDTLVFVVHVDGVVRAYVDSCPHAFAPLEMEPDRFLDISRQHILCSLHGAHFDPSSGRCLMGPCQGRGLSAYPVRVDNGMVIVAPPPDGI